MYGLYDFSEVSIIGNHWVDFFKSVPNQSKLFLYQSDSMSMQVSPVKNNSYVEVIGAEIKSLGIDKGLSGLFITTYLGFKFFPLGIFFRAVFEKLFHQVVKHTPIFYVSKSFDDEYTRFIYGQPIVLFEGILDAEVFSYITQYPFIMAYLTSSVSVNLASFLSILTDKVVIVPDTDKWGMLNLERSKKNLSKFGVNFRELILPCINTDMHDFYVQSTEIDLQLVKRFFDTIY